MTANRTVRTGLTASAVISVGHLPRVAETRLTKDSRGCLI
jgi:hypothetical protein